MSIRLARFADHWRRALERRYPVRYERLQYSGLRSLHDEVITFANGITAIVGGNGVGKSTLAHAAVDVLTGTGEVRALSDRRVRLSGGAFKATVWSEGGSAELRLTIPSEGSRQHEGEIHKEVFWLDPAELAVVCQRKILGDPGFTELLESIGSRQLTQTEIESASYVVGKDYTACDVWEVSDYGDLDVLPYFRVTSNGVTYGSESMGSGELSLLISLWLLNGVAKNSIVVLEEPETHVSPRSQDALMNLAAWACDTRGLWVILTTHSPVILRRLPLENIRLLVTDGCKSRLVSQPTLHQIGAILGGGIAYRGLLLVEDECAKYFIQSVLELLKPDLRHQLTVVVAKGGESRLAAVLCQLPHAPGWFLVGAFDGDMREKLRTDEFQWPHIFLPGNAPPEQLLRSTVSTIGAVERLAAALHTTSTNITVAISAAAGRDHHDWLTELCRVLGPSTESVVRALARVWIDVNGTDARDLIVGIERAFNSSNNG